MNNILIQAHCFYGFLQGRFQILCLSGSYLVAEDGGPRNRTGGVSVSLCSPDGHVVGGGVAMLMAASPVQVFSFTLYLRDYSRVMIDRRVTF